MAKRRLRGFDYTSVGAYFVTICAYERDLLFEDREIQDVIVRCWLEMPEHFANVRVDSFVVMPNHLHGIVNIIETEPGSVGQFHEIALQNRVRGTRRGSLSRIVQAFKAAVTLKLRNDGFIDLDQKVWQSNFYDRVIRDDAELERVRLYIANNPAAWAFDHENPECEVNASYVAAWGWLEGVDG